METREKSLYEFGPFSLDIGRSHLLRGGRTVPIPPKVLEILLALIRNEGDLVTKEELIKIVWPQEDVAESSLSWSISVLRKALGDSPSKAQYIETGLSAAIAL